MMTGGLPLRIVVVNQVHPSVPHVSSMRAWHFGMELAARGHQVVMICEWTEGVEPAPAPHTLNTLLRDHDWSRPLVLAVQPGSDALLDLMRSARTPTPVRKMLVAWSFVTRSGVFSDFSRAAAPFEEQLAGHFKPQVVWGSFGKTDVWLIAQRQARLAGCPWVGDMKDAWDSWIPLGLRSLLARRFRNMSASTANAQFHADVLARTVPTRPVVIYSGVDPGWLLPATESREGFSIVLIGSTYSRRNLDRFLDGLRAWVGSVPAGMRDQISLHYAGPDSDRVQSAVAALSSLIRVDVRDYLSLDELAALCRASAVNVYLWSPTTFHHKVVELLCCRRPIISFPGERDESVEMATQVGGSLTVCADERQIQQVLDRLWQGELEPTGGPDRLQHLTWAAQAVRLEEVLTRAAAEGARGVER